MRHLYAAAKEPGVSYLIDKAKTYERRRCNHLPEDYPDPLSTRECLASVVDPKSSNTNKHRYVVASQELEVRKHMRGVMGVPLVYINRSVMIMEPMADATAGNREKEERRKFRDGLKSRGSGSLKRNRDDGDEASEEHGSAQNDALEKSKKRKRVKEPNPLSVKKPKKKQEGEDTKSAASGARAQDDGNGAPAQSTLGTSDPNVKRKRKRKHKSTTEGGEKVAAVGI